MKHVYLQKLNELELEKEELEFYKRKYKQKSEKASQEQRTLNSTFIKEVESSVEPDESSDARSEYRSAFEEESQALAKEKELLDSLKQQLECEKARFRRMKNKYLVHKKILGHHWNSSDFSVGPHSVASLGQKSLSEKQLKTPGEPAPP